MRVSLPQNDGNPATRAQQLADSRTTYQYAYDWPAGVATAATLPKADNYSIGYALKSTAVYLKIAANLAAMTVDGLDGKAMAERLRKRFDGVTPDDLGKLLLDGPRDVASTMPTRWPKSWSDFEQVFKVWDPPAIVAEYHKDARSLDRAFAWQRVAGVNPMVLARCTALPDNFPVDDARYGQVMNGDTLAAAAAENRLYLADYAQLDGLAAGITDGIQKYVSAPIALFAVDKTSGALEPVAIQCGQVPGPKNPLVSPGEGWRWRMAMSLVQIADANLHEGVAHLGRTHMVMEAVKLAMERQLAQAHPLYALLKPHTATTLAINQSAKTSLVAAGGTVDRCFAPQIDAFCAIVEQAVATFRLDETSPAMDFATRGLDDVVALPSHPYRDDALLLWAAIERFVAAYVGIYYPNDAAVDEDTELQSFVAELGARDGGRICGVPPAHTIAELEFLLTRLIFIAGPQHSAVNFTQFPFMGFVTNMPGASYCPQLDAETPDAEAEYTKMLPPWRIVIEDTSMIYLLSNMRDSTLGDYGFFDFLDLRVHEAVSAFQANLKDVEATIVARDSSRFMSYPWLRPSQILQSISI